MKTTGNCEKCKRPNAQHGRKRCYQIAEIEARIAFAALPLRKRLAAMARGEAPAGWHATGESY